jgi:hypothetical protein
MMKTAAAAANTPATALMESQLVIAKYFEADMMRGIEFQYFRQRQTVSQIL